MCTNDVAPGVAVHPRRRIVIVASAFAALALAGCCALTANTGTAYPPDCKSYVAYVSYITHALHVCKPGTSSGWQRYRFPGDTAFSYMAWDIAPGRNLLAYTGIIGPASHHTDYVEVASSDGRVVRRLDGFCADALAFNRAGDKIALAGIKARSSFGLYVWDPSTGTLDCLAPALFTSKDGYQEIGLSWAGDDKIVTEFPGGSIESIDVATKQRTLVVDSGTAPSVSPDGRYMSYARGWEIILRDLSTGQEWQLVDQAHYEESRTAWTADSAFVAYKYRARLPLPLGSKRIAVIRASDREKYVVHSHKFHLFLPETEGMPNMSFVGEAELQMLAPLAVTRSAAP